MMGAQPTLIDGRQIGSLARVLTRNHRYAAPDASAQGALLLGSMQQHEVQPGLYLRINRLRDRVGLYSTANVAPGVKIAVVWKGETRIRFGQRVLALGGSERSHGMVVALDEPATFARQGIKGGLEHSAILTLTPGWLARRLHIGRPSQLLPVPEPDQKHLAQHYWRPSPALITRLAALSDADTAAPLARLEYESIALAIISEMLRAVGSPLSHCETPNRDWVTRLERMIVSGEANSLNQAQLAARLGMSPRQLQRRTRQHYGSPLEAYLRRCRLEHARHALEQEGISVENAAAMAGYSSAANFATAFKRTYGISPRQCRRSG